MLYFNEIINQYLLHFKKYCLNLDLSLKHRTSIRSSKDTTPKFQEITKFFSDGEIEKEFESLQNALNKYPDTKHLELYTKFNNFFKEKTSHSRKRRYLGRYFAHPMMQNRRAKRDDYKPSAALVTGHYVP
ncbi:hypothetical protein [Piscirickettsia salmonis]|uniref:hypothetical protein n=1 Tax=Piscirickettsia salmonis TaxID=1238 RepID=UPI0007C94CC1|nr:hypothetical protein A0O36_01301 [Piscirickettsiaceae bacterium NZ-RLO1]